MHDEVLGSYPSFVLPGDRNSELKFARDMLARCLSCAVRRLRLRNVNAFIAQIPAFCGGGGEAMASAMLLLTTDIGGRSRAMKLFYRCAHRSRNVNVRVAPRQSASAADGGHDDR